MYNRDYTREIGLPVGEKIVPLRYALPLLAALAALFWLGTRALPGPGTHASAPEPVTSAPVKT